MQKEETAFEQACKFVMEEAISNIFADIHGMENIKIRKILWSQIYVYIDKDGNEIELKTPPNQLIYTDYDQSLKFKDSYIKEE